MANFSERASTIQSSLAKDTDPALTLLSLKHGREPSKNLSNISPIAKLEGREFEYLVRQNKLSIGRNSRLGDVDINMGHSSFVSRKHLDIRYDPPYFFLTTRGKNGIFVDGQFHSKGSDAVKLSNKYVFYSTKNFITCFLFILVNLIGITLLLSYLPYVPYRPDQKVAESKSWLNWRKFREREREETD